jgi:glycosyltransferase involved in cell wall biosynthesis
MTGISFIICTRNRSSALRRALDSIVVASQTEPETSVEIIVVDNGSTDATMTLASQWAETAALAVRVIYEPRQGLAIARNAGVRDASGDILVFTDDDCQVSPCYIRKLLDHYTKDQEPVIRGGRVERGDPRDLAFTIKTDPMPARLRYDVHPGGFILGCNMAMTREIIERIGTFDERFGAGSPFKAAEETDYFYRAYLAGIPVEYQPDMVVFHYHGRRDVGELRKLHHGYSVGNGALHAKHGWSLFKYSCRDIRDSIAELVFGKRHYRAELGISYGSVVIGSAIGVMLYWKSSLSERIRSLGCSSTQSAIVIAIMAFLLV